MGDQGPERTVAGASQDGTSVARAMNEVIAAERAAIAGVETCRADCAQQVAAARLEARGLLDRAELIAQAIHARTERIAEARARAATAGAPDLPATPEPLEDVVERVAAWLAGEGSGDG
jgi:regulator of protease activity HflC (stomatin/prohibitin superfamily)